MPKAKRKQKAAEATAAPVGSLDVSVPASSVPDFQQKRTVPAVKKLGSLERNEKWQGCNDIAALALEDGATPTLIASGACEKLAVLLHDDSPSVRLASTRALLNLVHTGGVSVADRLSHQVTPDTFKSLLVASLQGLKEALQNPAQKVKGDVETANAEVGKNETEVKTAALMGECAVDTVQLIGAVGYNVEAVVFALGADVGVLESLIDCTPMHNVQTKQSSLSIAAAELLLILCDEHEKALHTIRNGISAAHQQALQAIVTSDAVSPAHTLMKVVMSGLFLQLYPHSAGQVLPFIFGIIRDIHPHNLCTRLIGIKSSNDKERALKGAATQQLVFNLKSLKTALELCVNLVCSTEAANDDEEDEEKFAKTDIGRVLISGGIGQLVGQKASELLGACENPATEKTLRSPEYTKEEEVQEQYAEAEAAMIVLLMNLQMALPLDGVGSPPAIWSALKAIFARDAALIQSLSTPSNDPDSTPNQSFSKDATEKSALGRLENLCCCLWTVLRKGWETNVADGSEDLQFIVQLVEFARKQGKAKNADFSANALRLFAEAVGGEGKQGGAQYHEAVKQVGQLCMDSLHEASLSVNVEAMHTIIDIFSDDQHDATMKSLNMLRHLLPVEAKLGEKINIVQSTSEIPMELEPRLDTVMSNLQPFIEYKQQRLGVRC